MLQDHHVSFRSEESIAKRTEQLRAFAGMSHITKLSVTSLITNYLSDFLERRGPVAVKPFDRKDKEGNIAYTTFSPRTINYFRSIWTTASLGSSYYRLVFAHEIGHVDLHDVGAKPFLRDIAGQLSFDQEGTSAEWQAIMYSYHLLMPDWTLELYDGAESLAQACGVEPRIAQDRIFRHERKLKFKTVTGRDFCRECGCVCDTDNSLYCQSCLDEQTKI